MTSAKLTSTQAPPEPAARPQTTYSRTVTDRAANSHSLAHPEAAGRHTSAQPSADRRRGPVAVHVAARRLRRALADSTRAWALAAGVPPDLYH